MPRGVSLYRRTLTVEMGNADPDYLDCIMLLELSAKQIKKDVDYSAEQIFNLEELLRGENSFAEMVVRKWYPPANQTRATEDFRVTAPVVFWTYNQESNRVGLSKSNASLFTRSKNRHGPLVSIELGPEELAAVSRAENLFAYITTTEILDEDWDWELPLPCRNLYPIKHESWLSKNLVNASIAGAAGIIFLVSLVLRLKRKKMKDAEVVVSANPID